MSDSPSKSRIGDGAVDQPLLSIALPIYRAPERPLAELLQSVEDLRCALPDERVELVASEDPGPGGPSAATRDLVARHGGTYVRNERALGMAANWNRTVQMSSGHFVIVAGQDDRLHGPGVVRALALLREHPEAAACGGARVFIDLGGRSYTRSSRSNDRSRLFHRGTDYLLPPSLATYLLVRNGNVIGEVGAVTIRRTAFDRTGGFDPSYRHAADQAMWLELCRDAPLLYTTTTTIERRIHEGRLTEANLTTGTVDDEKFRILDDCFERLPAEARPRVLAAAAGHGVLASWRAVRGGRLGDAYRHLARAASSAFRAGAGADVAQIVELTRNRNLDAGRPELVGAALVPDP